MTDETTEEKKEAETSENQEYVGPPKSHAFQDNTPSGLALIDRNHRGPLPSKIDADEQIDEQSILMNSGDFKGDGGNSELLRAIVAQNDLKVDEKSTKKKKKVVKKPEVSLKEQYEELLKKIQEKRRQYKEFCDRNAETLHKLNIVWIVAKVAFYGIGFTFFGVCLFFYLSFGSIIRSYLNENGLENVTFERIDHSLTGFTISGISEKNGLFSINQVKAQYNFADLLKRKIPYVGIDTLKVEIQQSEDAQNTSEEFARILLGLGLFRNDSFFSVGYLNFENSKLIIGNKEYQFPISFKGTGNIGEAKHLVFPIKLANDYIRLDGSVDVDVAGASSSWKMDIASCTLTLPSMEPKDLKGTLTFTTAMGNIASLNFEGAIKDDEIDQNISLYMARNDQNLWTVRLTARDTQQNDAATYSLNLSNVHIAKDLKSFKTESSVALRATDFKLGYFKADEIKLSARGYLFCDVEGCVYYIREKSDIVFFNPAYSFYEMNFSSAFPINVEISPSEEMALKLRKDLIIFNLDMGENIISLRKQAEQNQQQSVDIDLVSSQVRGSYFFKDDVLNIESLSLFRKFDDSNFLLKDGRFKFSLSQEGLNAQLETQKARLKTFDYFKPEFSLNLTILPDYYFQATVVGEKNNLALNTSGYFNPYTLGVLMAVQTTKPIIFGEGQLLPQELSSFFNDKFSDVTGQIRIKGEIYYKGPRSISGPLKVSLDDLSFKYGNSTVKNLNGVLNISQLVPFGAQGVQNIFVGSITNVLPFQNINAEVFFDANNRKFNFSSLSAEVAGYPLLIDPMWYSYTAPIYNFNFKGKPVPMQSVIDATTLSDLKIKGLMTAHMTLQVEDANFSLKTLEMIIPSEGTIQYTPEIYKDPFLESLKHLDFRKLGLYLSERNKENTLIFSSENKTTAKSKRKTNFRMRIDRPLYEFILPQKIVVPDFVAEEKGKF